MKKGNLIKIFAFGLVLSVVSLCVLYVLSSGWTPDTSFQLSETGSSLPDTEVFKTILTKTLDLFKIAAS